MIDDNFLLILYLVSNIGETVIRMASDDNHAYEDPPEIFFPANGGKQQLQYRVARKRRIQMKCERVGVFLYGIWYHWFYRLPKNVVLLNDSAGTQASPRDHKSPA